MAAACVLHTSTKPVLVCGWMSWVVLRGARSRQSFPRPCRVLGFLVQHVFSAAVASTGAQAPARTAARSTPSPPSAPEIAASSAPEADATIAKVGREDQQ